MAAPGVASQRGSLAEIARAYLLLSATVKCETAEGCVETIVAAASLMAHSLRGGGKILICGNGGSAADSQHLAAEFVSVLDKNRRRPAMAAIALTTDSSILTAITNDFGYAEVFERQVEALGRAGDVLLGISTSGTSENVIRALQLAVRKQMRTIALTGVNAGRVGALAEVIVTIPSSDVQHIQEAHLAVEHLLCRLTETALFEGN
ncbi:MAG: SIS domain-containing protein [Terriglobales bacterium]